MINAIYVAIFFFRSLSKIKMKKNSTNKKSFVMHSKFSKIIWIDNICNYII